MLDWGLLFPSLVLFKPAVHIVVIPTPSVNLSMKFLAVPVTTFVMNFARLRVRLQVVQLVSRASKTHQDLAIR
jgi:hypothetical protein